MVLYFSGTGNSRYAAKKIAEISGDEILSVNQRIKEKDYRSVHSDTPFVFVGPVYAGRFPRVMDEYISKTAFTGNKQAYFIATCAATPWLTVDYARKLSDKKAFCWMGFHAFLMPQGYVVGGGTKPKEENDKTLTAAKPEIEKIAETIRDHQALPEQQPGKAMMSKILNPIMYTCMISAKGFHVTEQCTSCGKCAARCPLNNIRLTDGKPEWGRNCTHCMACIAGCPATAIEYGKKTQGKPRYYLGDE